MHSSTQPLHRHQSSSALSASLTDVRDDPRALPQQRRGRVAAQGRGHLRRQRRSSRVHASPGTRGSIGVRCHCHPTRRVVKEAAQGILPLWKERGGGVMDGHIERLISLWLSREGEVMGVSPPHCPSPTLAFLHPASSHLHNPPHPPSPTPPPPHLHGPSPSLGPPLPSAALVPQQRVSGAFLARLALRHWTRQLLRRRRLALAQLKGSGETRVSVRVSVSVSCDATRRRAGV